MTIEEITQTLQTVAENQSRHSEHMAEMESMQAKHSADIAEIDRMLAASLQSQNRYDEQLSAIREIMHDLADKHLKNEERFAEMIEARRVNEMRLDKMEASYELLEQFVRDFREENRARHQETDNHFTETDKRMAEFVGETNGRFTETDKKLAELAVAQAKTDEQMNRTDEQIKALVAAQTRTDEQIRSLLDRNGSRAELKAKKKPAKKTHKKGSAK